MFGRPGVTKLRSPEEVAPCPCTSTQQTLADLRRGRQYRARGQRGHDRGHRRRVERCQRVQCRLRRAQLGRRADRQTSTVLNTLRANGARATIFKATALGAYHTACPGPVGAPTAVYKIHDWAGGTSSSSRTKGRGRYSIKDYKLFWWRWVRCRGRLRHPRPICRSLGPSDGQEGNAPRVARDRPGSPDSTG